jgi:hypothetical protein
VWVRGLLGFIGGFGNFTPTFAPNRQTKTPCPMQLHHTKAHLEQIDDLVRRRAIW